MEPTNIPIKNKPVKPKNSTALFVLALVLVQLGIIGLLWGPYNFYMVNGEFNDCLHDCFLHCSWCSMDQLTVLELRRDVAHTLMLALAVTGIICIIIGIIIGIMINKRSKNLPGRPRS